MMIKGFFKKYFLSMEDIEDIIEYMSIPKLLVYGVLMLDAILYLIVSFLDLMSAIL